MARSFGPGHFHDLIFKTLADLEPEFLFHILAGLLGFLGRFLCLLLGAGREAIGLTLDQNLVLFHSLFTEGGEPIPNLVDRGVLGAIRGIGGHGNPPEHKSENKERDHEFTHGMFPFVGLDY